MNPHNWNLKIMVRRGLDRLAPNTGAVTGLGLFWLLLATVSILAPLTSAQELTSTGRELAEAMLQNVSSDVRTHYFDPKLRGLDWDALTLAAKQNIKEAPDMAAANAQIQGLLEHLNDSHSNFFPPSYQTTANYGWDFTIIGKRAFVTRVDPKSDAENKGVRPGDELLTINGFTVERASAWKLKYAMNVLSPRANLQLDLRDPAGKVLHLDVSSKLQKHMAVNGLGGSSWWINQRIIDREDAWNKERAEAREFGPELMILRIPAFVEAGVDVDSFIKKARAHKSLIVDLRGTPGGRVDSVLDFLAGIFNRDVKVGQELARNRTTTITVKGNRHGAFEGDLIVLIDSESASAAEIFARVVQLEERGAILGDRSSGHVMEGQIFPHHYGDDPVYFYGSMITIADTVMSDGKSLEGVGVEPDRTFLPTAADLAAGRDPVLAYAAGLAGVTLSPEDAAKLFPRQVPEE
jgi:carboxyl-terminal processing protease